MAVEVRRDGVVKQAFDSGDPAEDHSAAFTWLLHAQSQSVAWATRYEGWEITSPPQETERTERP
jgi:hypothetical protein